MGRLAALVLMLPLACAHSAIDSRRTSPGPGCEFDEACWTGGESVVDDIVSIGVASALIGVICIATLQRLLGDH
jgi:hypothetical protein